MDQPTVDNSFSSELSPPPSVAYLIYKDRLDIAVKFSELLATTGVTHGLIGPREVPRLWSRHILNCAIVQDVLEPGVAVADIGSGAGLPGLALAIARPDLQLHLIEPLARRVTWLSSAVEDLGLTNVVIHHARAEALAGQLAVPVVTARAVARLAKLAMWAAPLLSPGGELVALKGTSAYRELEEDRQQIASSGGCDSRVELLGEGTLEDPTTLVRIRFTSVQKRNIRMKTSGKKKPHHSRKSQK
ncbi:16S rRNA (guanine(527)-N(7))-methyltransferase RsmG [Dermatophilus congolensis]|uniref:16S rRNA (guanine(527)-N(7))-methyltransferase RsmG n=1 Tax=Dermatophilus congolensis TaxID=1863 RepID=UPI000A020D9C|nr:16S rRNA (guanine(527)-N(7))-methyltransferase RsmG [Dermatophilus congolensis]MBO3130485.1 16S rRNA (guanine(527)-N(7))-methyltransferase RsmG [Dermatophilus congolensis]MBO3130885.1 16S rRNA (guanine(527)-N(7))-methyltransferase RsmG [Dermatophilus congolensis]MBO3134957.1 16S rRNA (guanine(527)-N(7))-methyltransferase RsmG [Dermatophilus congolensis]MBO3137196.1 16S rRNA (guanine(527)-N(7))-methyltransferase RsmG [Dermatophilus congolensis]MBO3139439.1 16S rRNA (guanine(527)-N(7))-methyl